MYHVGQRINTQSMGMSIIIADFTVFASVVLNLYTVNLMSLMY